MITFRFYVVSTVAFFLALAVGIVVGSALDQRIVDQMEDTITRVERSLDDTVAAIDEKNREIGELERYVSESAPFTVEGRLEDTAVLLVAEEGVAPGPVEGLGERLRQAGATVEAIVWLTGRFDLEDAEDRAAFAAASGVLTADPSTTRTQGWDVLVDQLAPEPELPEAPGSAEPDPEDRDTTTTTDPDAGAPEDPDEPVDPTGAEGPETPVPSPLSLELLEAWEAAGLVNLQAVDDPGGPASSLAVVIVTGPDSELAAPGEVAAELASGTASRAPTVVAEVFAEGDDDPVRGTTLEALRGEGDVGVSTVDDLELIAGRVAVVLALADLREGVVGHYGYGRDTEGVVPPWRTP